MDAITAGLIGSVLTAVTALLGWFVVHRLTRSREAEAREAARAQADRTRRLELRLGYHQRQIQEFYAPLHSNIQLILNVSRIGVRIETELPDKEPQAPIEDVKVKMWRTLRTKYFFPLHGEIKDILKSKLFLMDEVDMPKSYTDYLEHSVMAGIQTEIEEEDGIATWKVEAPPWPERFSADVKAGLDKAMRNYDAVVQELAKSAEALASPARDSPTHPRPVSS